MTSAGTARSAGSARARARSRTLDERRRQRREAMVAAALDLIGTRGFARTTIEDVCRRAGVRTTVVLRVRGDGVGPGAGSTPRPHLRLVRPES